ncbi:NAD(P)-dependent oxidoreductase [Deminuibacter soli]|uniref:Epimerase n=1 Tax=Deminuibacter soli TaxID=2291815 RepID=A0A3E1NIM4_9BACT|nr:NAD(P)H-binding protein [Deminuibacter soli]RFM27780.1 epimerase [Deminuibacter soli]
MQHTTIAVIGGTGKSGRYLVQQLISNRFPVKLLLRDPGKYPTHPTGITLVQGDARNYEAVHTLLEGCSAVISTLGQPKGESPIFSDATSNVIRAMHAHGITRYIVTTGLNVDTPADQKSAATALGTDWMKTHYPQTTADKQKEWAILAESNIDWTLVRLPLIALSGANAPINISLEDCPGDKISATALAHFLMQQLTDTDYLKAAPFIANR